MGSVGLRYPYTQQRPSFPVLSDVTGCTSAFLFPLSSLPPSGQPRSSLPSSLPRAQLNRSDLRLSCSSENRSLHWPGILDSSGFVSIASQFQRTCSASGYEMQLCLRQPVTALDKTFPAIGAYTEVKPRALRSATIAETPALRPLFCVQHERNFETVSD